MSSSLTFCAIKESVLQILTSRSSSLINAGTAFNSSDLWRRFCALLTTFYSNWLIFSLNKWLQFLVKSISQERISDLKEKKKHQNDLLDKISLDEMSYMQISFLVSQLILLLEGFPFDFFFKSYWCKGDDNNEVWADAQWH